MSTFRPTDTALFVTSTLLFLTDRLIHIHRSQRYCLRSL